MFNVDYCSPTNQPNLLNPKMITVVQQTNQKFTTVVRLLNPKLRSVVLEPEPS